MALLFSDDVVHHGRNLSAEWREIAPKVTVHPLPGSHLECITAHVDTLAQTIESCLQSVAVNSASRDAQSSPSLSTSREFKSESDD